VYIAGYANSSWGTPLHAYSGDYDAMIMKLNDRGEYQWHTYYGASPTSSEDGDDEGMGIAVNAAGDVYVTGYSDRTWQGPGNTDPLNAHGVSEEMFVLKLNSDGVYQWHTFYQPGRPNAIALDQDGVYVTGRASSSWGSPKHDFDGNLVILKLNSDGAYQWHTYYGAGASSVDEIAYGIASDPSHHALYITGISPDTWLGDGNTEPLHDFSGGPGYSSDIVVLKLDSDGNYQWHTFYGANGYDDTGYGVAVDGDGNPYITGESFDTWGSPLHALNGERDMAVLKLDANGGYQWNTFYGGSANDGGSGIDVDSNGNIYITGWSNNAWQGEGGADPAHPYSGTGGTDIVVLKLNTGGAYQRHTFYGADNNNDDSLSIAVDDNHNVYTTGLSKASWLGDGGYNPLHAHSQNLEGDSFVLKLSDQNNSLFLPFAIRQ
jgi:Beta-propeller repeat